MAAPMQLGIQISVTGGKQGAAEIGQTTQAARELGNGARDAASSLGQLTQTEQRGGSAASELARTWTQSTGAAHTLGQGARNAASGLGQFQTAGHDSAAALDRMSLSASRLLLGGAGLFVLIAGIASLSQAVLSLPKSGFDYSKDLEVSAVGMAGILGSMATMHGRQLDYNQALGISQDMIRKLGDDALRTAASSAELTSTFQALLAPGLAARMTLDQIRQLTLVGVNAVKSIGLSGAQVTQELRDLVAGGITAGGSQLATALGLKDADIAKARASADGLFVFLMDKLKGFQASSDNYQNTLQGRLDSLKEGAVRASAQGIEPLTNEVSKLAKEMGDMLVTFDKAGTAQINPQLVGQLREYSTSAVQAWHTTRDLVSGVWEHRDAVVALAAGYAAIKTGQWASAAASVVAANIEMANASRLAAVQAAAQGTANVEVAATSRMKIAALLQELQIQQAAAQAGVAAASVEVAAAEAKTGNLLVTREAIVLSRSEVLAKIEATRTTIAQAEAQIVAARSAGALSFALALVREGTEAVSAAQARQTVLMSELALLGRQQASVQAALAASTAAQTLATDAQTLATNAAAAAAGRLAAANGAASLASRGLGLVVGALGGPFGVGIAAVTVMGMWLYKLKGNADDAAEAVKAVDRAEQSLATGRAVRDKDVRNINAQLEAARDKRDDIEGRAGNVAKNSAAQARQAASLAAVNMEIAKYEGLLKDVAAANSKSTTSTQDLALTLAGSRQGWEASIADAKTATSAQEEYTRKLQASQSAYKAYESAIKTSGKSEAEVAALLTQAQQRQRQAETAFAKERDEQLRNAAKSGGDYENLRKTLLGQIAVEQAKLGSTRQLTDAEKDRAQFLSEYDRKVLHLSASEAAAITGLHDKRVAVERLQVAEKARIKDAQAAYAQEVEWADEVAAAEVAASKAREQGWLALDEYARATRESGEAVAFESGLLGVNTEQRAIAIAQHQIELDLKKKINEINANTGFDQSQRDDAIARASATAEIAKQGAVAKAQFDSFSSTLQSIDSTGREVFASLFESGHSAFKSLGQTLKKELIDMLYELTVKKWVISVGASVFGGTAAQAAQAAAGGSGGGVGSLLSLASGASSAWNVLTNGLNNSIHAGFTKLATSDIGAKMGLSTTQTVSSGGASLEYTQTTALADQLGTAIGMAGDAFAAYGLQKAISGGYKIGNGNLVDVATVIGSAFLGPLAGVVGGVVNRAFGHKLTDGGIQGTFGGTSGFTGSKYTFEEGGWFSSDRTNTSALDAGTSQSLADSYKTLQVQTALMAQGLGQSADSIAGYTESVKVSLMGLSASDAAAKIQETLAGVQDNLAKLALGATNTFTATNSALNWLHITTANTGSDLAAFTSEFAKTGETATQTLTRLSSSLAVANTWMQALGTTGYAKSLTGSSSASNLIDAFGGTSAFSTSAQAYFDAYYSDAERNAVKRAQVADKLTSVGLAMPATRAEFRALASALDLTTASGQKAYAALLSVAPAFADAADAQAKADADAAAKMVVAATSSKGLVSALDVAQLHIDAVATSTAAISGELAFINAILGDSTSAVIGFANGGYVLSTGMTLSQASALSLTDQIAALKDGSDTARIDIDKLTTSLSGVNTSTFVAAIQLVFEGLATRIQSVIADINTERIALRDAAVQIINPTVLSRDEIARRIASVNTTLPSNAGVVAAQSALSAADASVAQKQAAQTNANAVYSAAAAAQSSAVASYGAVADRFHEMATYYGTSADHGWGTNNAYDYDPSTGQLLNWTGDGLVNGSPGQYLQFNKDARVAASANWTSATGIIGTPDGVVSGDGQVGSLVYQLANANATLAPLWNNLQAAAAAQTTAAAATAAAQSTQTEATSAAAAATTAYAAALQDFTIDAGKSVTKLTKLREETVKYYEAQAKLASLLTASADGIRKTVADYQLTQMTDAQKYAALASQFAQNYSLALATTGETAAGYADKLNALINPIIEAANAVGGSSAVGGASADSLVASYLAQANAVATRLDSNVTGLGDYQSDSLGLLGSIDATLAALDASSKSAEAIISDAVKAGADQTAAGLHAVIAAITGQTIPAFATGGAFTGGVVSRPTMFDMGLMGEAGPEGILPLTSVGGKLGVHARISGKGQAHGQPINQDALLAELQALRAQVAELHQVLDNNTGTIAINTGKTARLHTRWDADGLPATRADTAHA